MIRTAIFIKSWRKDRFFLDYALRSLEKRASGFLETILILPRGDEPHFDGTDFHGARVIWRDEPIPHNGYLSQQVFKHRAYEFTEAERILFVDSDAFAHRRINPAFYECQQGKLIHLISPYSSIQNSGGYAWKAVTEKALGLPVQFECMRVIPPCYWRETLIECVRYMEALHGRSLESYIGQQPGNSYSEFNSIGAFALAFQPHLYDWQIATGSDEEYPGRFEVAWSWASEPDDERGLTEARKARYAASLRMEE